MNIFAIFKMVFIPTRLSLLEGSRKITSRIRLSPNSTSNNLKESCEFLSNGELHSQDLYMLLKGKKKKKLLYCSTFVNMEHYLDTIKSFP